MASGSDPLMRSNPNEAAGSGANQGDQAELWGTCSALLSCCFHAMRAHPMQYIGVRIGDELDSFFVFNAASC